jgi:6-phosphogluconolactonase (cycloisomerase 2 family)
MRTRFLWILAILALVAIGFLMACSTKYSASSNGLVVVPSQGYAAMETFSLDLSNGHLSQINNGNGPPTNGLPTSVILDPAGAFAYVIVYQNPAVIGSVTGIQTFQVASDGKLAPIATTPMTNPVAIAMDSAGKFLFVANGNEGTVSVFSIGSNASLNGVGGATLPPQPGGQSPSASALAVTPTVFPPLYAYCSGFTPPAFTPPTTEILYVTDSVNYVLLDYSVSSTGSLTPIPSQPTGVPTGTSPAGVAVDPCNRFAYVTNGKSNNVSAYTICSVVSQSCQQADYSLQAVANYPAGDVPGPLAVDPYGNSLYVVNTGSNNLSGYQISPTNGTLTAFSGAPVATNSGPNSIAIRSDDTWIFVANFNSGTLSQYAITPRPGVLTVEPVITTFNQPTGVAVK